MTAKKRKPDIDLVIFDLDGTLLDTALYIVENWVHLFQKYHLPQIHLEEMVYFSGPPLTDLFKKYIPHVPVDELVKEFDDFSLLYSNYYSNLYDHEIETLEAMKQAGYKMSVMSNKKGRPLIDNLTYWKLDRYIDFVVSLDDVKHPKPDPEGLLKTLNHYGIPAGHTFTIGDSLGDIEAGKRASIHTGYAHWGLKQNPPVDAEEEYTGFKDIERSFILYD